MVAKRELRAGLVVGEGSGGARRGAVLGGMRMLVTPAMGGEKCFVRMAPCAGCMANGVLGRGRA